MASKKKLKPFALTFNARGQNERDGIYAIQPNSALEIKNLHMERVGEWSCYRQGDENFSAAIESGARVDAIGYFTTDGGLDRMAVACNGKIIKINTGTGAASATLTTDNTAGNSVSFEAFKGSLYMTEKTMTPKKWDGLASSTTDLSVFPKTVGSEVYNYPTIVEKYANRLAYANFQFGTMYPSHVAISDDLDPDSITTVTTNDTDGLVVQVSPGDGDSITAMKSLYLPNLDQEILVVFKNESTHRITGDTPSTFATGVISGSFGCLNPNCVVKVGADLFFIDVNNIYSLTTAFQSGTLQPKVLGSDMVEETLRDLNTTQKAKAWAAHMADRREVWFGIPTGSSTEVNTILVYKYPSNQQDPNQTAVWSIRKNMSTTCALVNDATLYTGTSEGRVRKWFNTSTYAGTGINWRYLYPFFNFGTPFQRKRILNCRAIFLVREDTSVTIKYRWRQSDDFKTKTTFAKTISTDGESLFGASVYGTGLYASGEGKLAYVPFEVFGEGGQCQFDISGTTEDVGPIFLGIEGFVEYGGIIRDYQ